MKWEYKTISVDVAQGFFTAAGAIDTAAVTGELNSAGDAGWELVSALDTTVQGGRSRYVVLVMKRAKR